MLRRTSVRTGGMATGAPLSAIIAGGSPHIR